MTERAKKVLMIAAAVIAVVIIVLLLSRKRGDTIVQNKPVNQNYQLGDFGGLSLVVQLGDFQWPDIQTQVNFLTPRPYQFNVGAVQFTGSTCSTCNTENTRRLFPWIVETLDAMEGWYRTH